MRKMKRSDVREWTPGEPIERVDFGNGCTGMDKSIPREPGSAGDFKRLIWKCRAIEADGGPCLDVLPSEYWIDDVKQGDYFFAILHDAPRTSGHIVIGSCSHSPKIPNCVLSVKYSNEYPSGGIHLNTVCNCQQRAARKEVW